MENETLKEFEAKLSALINEYKITDAAFCGTLEGRFMGGFMGKERLTASELSQSTVNVGRLWQFAREQMRRFWDQFESEAPRA